MIRKRETTNNLNNDNKNQNIESEIIKQPKNIDPSLRKEFKSYREEAIYVINLLKSQGVDIYDPNRYGGMYLKKHNSKIPNIFIKEKTDSNKVINNEENQFDKNELSKFFNKK